MYHWNKIKQFVRHRLYQAARVEVAYFITDCKDMPSHLKKHEERSAYKKDLTANYTYQQGDDLLAKKQDFIDKYTVNEREQYNYFVKEDLFGNPGEFRTRAWRNHEQIERREAQKAWCQVRKRNYHAHMRQKFMNQKTR